jgi:hypothetical protein
VCAPGRRSHREGVLGLFDVRELALDRRLVEGRHARERHVQNHLLPCACAVSRRPARRWVCVGGSKVERRCRGLAADPRRPDVALLSVTGAQQHLPGPSASRPAPRPAPHAAATPLRRPAVAGALLGRDVVGRAAARPEASAAGVQVARANRAAQPCRPPARRVRRGAARRGVLSAGRRRMVRTEVDHFERRVLVFTRVPAEAQRLATSGAARTPLGCCPALVACGEREACTTGQDGT